MKVLKMIIRIALIPLWICLVIIELICRLTQILSGWIFRIFGFILLLTAFGCFAFQLYDTQEIIRIFISGIVFMLLPTVGELIIAGIFFLKGILKINIKHGF